MKKLLKNTYVVDFMAAVMFFTRIPIHWPSFSDEVPNLTKAAWAFPLVGCLIGLCSGAIGDLCLLLGLPNLLSCVIAVALSVLISGAFHEDGLADMADGFGAGGTPKRINEIMHDSRLGTYGVVTLTLGLLLRIGLLVGLVELGYSMVLILSAGFSSGKLAIIFARNFYNPSEFTKAGSIVGVVSTKNWLLATFIWFLLVALFFPILGIILGAAFSATLIYFVGIRSNFLIGGISGDILGAVALLTELFFLLGVMFAVSGIS